VTQQSIGVLVRTALPGTQWVEVCRVSGILWLSYLGGDNADFIADEITEFLTGERPAIQVDRILTTVMFTDIVGSTEKAASLGDQRWRSLLDAHDRAVPEQLRRFRGKEINTTGTGS